MTKIMDHAAYMRKVKKMTESELRFVIDDCQNVILSWHPDPHPNEGYYMDEIHYCYGELRRRGLIEEVR